MERLADEPAAVAHRHLDTRKIGGRVAPMRGERAGMNLPFRANHHGMNAWIHKQRRLLRACVERNPERGQRQGIWVLNWASSCV